MRIKQKQEIKEKIEALRLSLCRYPDIPQRQQEGYKAVVVGQINTLKWVLGHKVRVRYFCTYCQRVHTNPKCPYCGSERIVEG